MARPYLESQAEGAEDPQTRRVYQSAVYLLEDPRPHPGARHPLHRGPARRAPTTSAPPASTARSSPRCGASCSPCGPRGLGIGVDHAPPRQRGRGRRAARHPRGHDPGRADPGRLLHRRRLQARGAPAGRGHHLLGHLGKLPASNPSAPARSRTPRCPLSSRASRPPRRGRGPSPSSAPPPVTPARPTGSSGPASTRTPRAWPPRCRRAGVGPGVHVGRPRSDVARRSSPPSRRSTWPAAPSSPLPLPMRLGSIEEFVEQTRRRIASADAALVVVDRDLAPFLDPPPERLPRRWCCSTSSPPRARASAPAAWTRPPDDPDRLAILQFTSGSTAAPKGVMLPDRCVGANIDAIIAGARLTHADRAVSWLPLYHDMGLIGLLMAPMLHGFELVLGAPQDFLARPRAGWSGSPSTAAPSPRDPTSRTRSRRARCGAPTALDLSSWRLALNGAETVDPNAVESFCAAAAPFGFDARAAYPVFGMAEATLAVTFPAVGEGMTVDAVDRHALEHDRHGGARRRRRAARVGAPAGEARPPARRVRAAHRRSRSPARCAASARSASWSCAARRSRPGTTATPRPPPRPSTTAGCAPATSRTSSTASSWCAVARRT